MIERFHRRLALIAYERGLLSAQDMAEAMLEIGRREAHGNSPGLGVWFENSWLDQAQMAEVLAELGMLPEILVHGEDKSGFPALERGAEALRELVGMEDPATAERERTRERRYDSVAQTIMHADAQNAPSAGRDAPPTSEIVATEPAVNLDETLGGFESEATNASRPPPTRRPEHRTLAYAPEPGRSGRPAVPVVDPRERYVLGGELGKGGGGVVVRAFDRALGRAVAMKVLPANSGADAKMAARFMAEAQATGQLEHPNIVSVYDFGTLPSGELYYTMREVRRHSLRDALVGLQRGSPHYSEEYGLVRLVSILRQVAQAVDYAHVRGVIHRDLKPDNIMVGDYGEVLVMDWGLARVMERPARINLAEQAARDETGHTLGTPAYMPPEQARGDLKAVDEQSDVYGLGAILYEILTLEPPFVAATPVETMWSVVESPVVPPRQRAPERNVPMELERICMRALEKDKALRHDSVREFHEELEDWIEGLQPREARRRVEGGRRASQLYTELSVRIEDLGRAVRALSADIEGWEPLERKRELWALEDQLDQARVERARAFGEAVSRFTQALAYQPENQDARKGLVNVYWKQLEDARARNSLVDAIYFEALVRQYDDGRYARLLDGSAGLEVRTEPEGADVKLHKLVEVDRRLVEAESRFIGVAPVEVAELEDGAFLIELTLGGRPAIRRPVQLQRGKSRPVEIEIPPEELFRSGFIRVPEGPYITGGDPEAFDPRPRQVLEIEGFFCAEFPVTFREYLEMVNEFHEDDPERALAYAPQTRAEEGLLVRWDEENGLWVPDEILIEGPAREQYPVGEGHEWELPVVGVNHRNALDYCSWRSARDGVEYRLPTEFELEKAGRGVDGRFFPWGNKFDPTFCKMRFSRPELPQLEPVGAFPDDCSPYGVRDLAGGVQEWCRSRHRDVPDQPVKGGSWNQDARACRLASRVKLLAAARSAGIGFRLVF